MVIKKITKVGLFYKVTFDNDASYKFHESVIIKYSFLRKKILVTEEKLDNAIKDNMYYLALDKGIKHLSTLRAKYDVYIYLKRYFDEDICRNVLEKLTDLKLVNDQEYAKEYVAFAKKKQYGPHKIFEELKASKVIEDDIYNALEDYSMEEEKTICELVFDKYLPSLKKYSVKLANNKMREYLANRGFSNESITNIIEKKRGMLDNISDEDKLLVIAYEKLLKAKKSKDEREFKNKAIRSLTAKGFPLSKVLKIVERRK